MADFSNQIENRNFLSPTGFKFTLTRSPKVVYFCNSANIPDLNLGVTQQNNYFRSIPRPGEIIEFGDLNIRFLVDEDLKNYMEIQNWIRGLGFPENADEFSDFEKNAPLVKDEKELQIFSDGTLFIQSNDMVPKFQVRFQGLFPYSLSTIDFDATDTSVEYFTADVSFKYTLYVIEDLLGNKL